MWLRSEKRERHLLSSSLGPVRSSRGSGKRGTVAPGPSKTGATWKQAIKRDIARNGIKNITKSVESIAPKTIGAAKSNVKDKCIFTKSMEKGAIGVRCSQRMNANSRGTSPQAKLNGEKITPLRPKGLFVNRLESKKTQVKSTNIKSDCNNKEMLNGTLCSRLVNGNASNICVRNGQSDKVIGFTRSAMTCKTTKSVLGSKDERENRVVNDNAKQNGVVRSGQSFLPSPRKSRRLEKSERSTGVNGSPSRKVRQLPKRPISQTVPTTKKIAVKRHSSTDVAKTNDIVKETSPEVPTAELVASDWAAIVDQEMTMYEKELGKLSDLEQMTSEESDSEANVSDTNLCLPDDRLNEFITIESSQFVEIKTDSAKDFTRCSSVDRKSFTIDINDRGNTKSRKLSTSVRKSIVNIDCNKATKRRSSAIELTRSYSSKDNMRRVSCEKLSEAVVKIMNADIAEIDEQLDVSAFESFQKLPVLNLSSDDLEELTVKKSALRISVDLSPVIDELDKVRLGKAIVDDVLDQSEQILASCASVLQGIEQPDFISMLDEEDQGEICKRQRRR